MATWLTLLLAAIGGGSTGAIITTWSATARDRRQARANVRQALAQAEEAAVRAQDGSRDGRKLVDALDHLDTAVMLAHLPRVLTDLYKDATVSYWVTTAPPPPRAFWEPPIPEALEEALRSCKVTRAAALHFIHVTRQLLTDATWHPWRTAPYRAWRTRRLARILYVNTKTPPLLRHYKKEQELIGARRKQIHESAK
jgi:hypothetical protein